MPNRSMLILLLVLCALASSQAMLNITLKPHPIVLKTEARIPLNVTVTATGPVPSGTLRFTIRDSRIARLPVENETSIQWVNVNSTDPDGQLVQHQLTIQGVRLGWTDILFHFHINSSNASSNNLLASGKARVAVLRDQTMIQAVYRYIIIVSVVVLTIGMGCTIDIYIVIKLVKRPIGLAVGWCTQFILMPHLGVAVGQLLLLLVTDLDNAVSFAYGILTMACSPGGGSSNVWTLLFDGDLDLSMTMTFLSQVCALFMMPLWLFVYSRLYVDVDLVQIPYEQVAYNLLQLVIPVLFGVALKWRWPNVAYKVSRAIKPFTVIFVLFVIGFGTYVNFFLFELIAQLPIIIPFAGLLPWLGFLFSYIVTIILRLGRRQAVAIALEAGIQNIGIPILILQFSMPKPDGDLAAIVPLIVVLVTPIPLYFLLAIKKIRDRLNRGQQYSVDELDTAIAAADGGEANQSGVEHIAAETLKSGHTVDMSDYGRIQFERSTDHLTGINGDQ